MPDGVHARVHAVQPAGTETVGDSAVAQTQFDELTPRHDTMLRRRESRNGRVQWTCSSY